MNCAQNETPRPNIRRRGAPPPIFHFFTAFDRLGMGPTAHVTEYEDEQGYTPARSGSFCWILGPRRLAIFEHVNMFAYVRVHEQSCVSPAWNLITYFWWYTCSLRGYLQSQSSYMDYGLYKYKLAELASRSAHKMGVTGSPVPSNLGCRAHLRRADEFVSLVAHPLCELP